MSFAFERCSAPTPAPFMDVARAIDGQHAWLGCEVFPLQKRRRARRTQPSHFYDVRDIECPRSVGPREPCGACVASDGAPGAPARANCAVNASPAAAGENCAPADRACGSRPRARARAARPAPRVQRPRRRAPMRRRPSRAPAAGAQVGVFFARTPSLPDGLGRTSIS